MLMRSPLASPSLENLSYILRRRDFWPEGFHWDFTFRCSCALGLAYNMWPVDDVQKMFDAVPVDDFEQIFCCATNKPKVKVVWWIKRLSRHSDVTPEMVADQIDAYLVKHQNYRWHV